LKLFSGTLEALSQRTDPFSLMGDMDPMQSTGELLESISKFTTASRMNYHALSVYYSNTKRFCLSGWATTTGRLLGLFATSKV